MTKYLLDIAAGCFRPVWTDMEAIGFLAYYLDANDKSPAEDQMTEGYVQSAGISPYQWLPQDWKIDENGNLLSLQHGELFIRVSECIAGDGSEVIMFESAMTIVARDGEIVWIARLD